MFLGVDGSVPTAAPLPVNLAEAVDLLDVAPADSLLCIPAASRSIVVELARLLRAGVRPDVRLVELPVPPTATVVVAAVLDVGAFPDGVVHALARLVAQRCPAYTLVDSVASFTEPAPSVLQHAWSLVPGRRFLVSTLPPQVSTAAGALPDPPNTACLTVSTSAADLTSQRWRELLEAQFSGAQSVPVTLAAPGPPGARRWAELTAVPVPLEDVAEQVGAELTIVACPWCSAPTAGDHCLHCGSSGDGQPSSAGSASTLRRGTASTLFPGVGREAPATTRSRRAS